MKPSHEPPYWLLFGAGGMLAALVGAAMVLVTGLAGPAGVLLPESTLDYANASAFARHPLGKAFLFAVVTLFLWHAAHRIFHTLHDLGMHANAFAWAASYGSAMAGTGIAAVALLAIG